MTRFDVATANGFKPGVLQRGLVGVLVLAAGFTGVPLVSAADETAYTYSDASLCGTNGALGPGVSRTATVGGVNLVIDLDALPSTVTKVFLAPNDAVNWDDSSYNLTCKSGVVSFEVKQSGNRIKLLEIGSHLLSNATSLRSVKFPKRLETLNIGNFAFAQTNVHDHSVPSFPMTLTSITFPENLEALNIGKYAFSQETWSGNTVLQSVKFPDDLKALRIAEGGFQQNASAGDTSLAAIVFPDSLKTLRIDSYAFSQYTFDGLGALKMVLLPAHLEALHIEGGAFSQLDFLGEGLLRYVVFPTAVMPKDTNLDSYFVSISNSWVGTRNMPSFWLGDEDIIRDALSDKQQILRAGRVVFDPSGERLPGLAVGEKVMHWYLPELQNYQKDLSIAGYKRMDLFGNPVAPVGEPVDGDPSDGFDWAFAGWWDAKGKKVTLVDGYFAELGFGEVVLQAHWEASLAVKGVAPLGADGTVKLELPWGGSAGAVTCEVVKEPVAGAVSCGADGAVFNGSKASLGIHDVVVDYTFGGTHKLRVTYHVEVRGDTPPSVVPPEDKPGGAPGVVDPGDTPGGEPGDKPGDKPGDGSGGEPGGKPGDGSGGTPGGTNPGGTPPATGTPGYVATGGSTVSHATFSWWVFLLVAFGLVPAGVSGWQLRHQNSAG
ncbi:MAG: leucine-rich repeat domain-containing protein [Propionibacteriaceae bacterium]|nr:leucine-rich repeat domain-containing protein [Propionibacteriaceae bacterium]